jgi:hypothetical protein
MQSLNEAVSAFLASKPVPVTWVFRTPKTHRSNNVYRRLRERGYDVFEVNPNTGQVEGDRCYRDLAVVRRDAVARYGTRLLAVLDVVSARLASGSLCALDAQVELAGRGPRQVARDWLRAQGLIQEGGVMH